MPTPRRANQEHFFVTAAQQLGTVAHSCAWPSMMRGRSVGLGRTRIFHPWRCEPEGRQAPMFLCRTLSDLDYPALRLVTCDVSSRWVLTFQIDHSPLHRIAAQFESAVWRVTIKPKNETSFGHVGFRPEKKCDYQRSSEHVVTPAVARRVARLPRIDARLMY